MITRGERRRRGATNIVARILAAIVEPGVVGCGCGAFARMSARASSKNGDAPHSGLLHSLADSARGNALWRSRWQDLGFYARTTFPSGTIGPGSLSANLWRDLRRLFPVCTGTRW